MNTERDKATRLQKMQRTFGMLPERREQVNRELELKADWYRRCPDGRKVYGTPAQLKREGICG